MIYFIIGIIVLIILIECFGGKPYVYKGIPQSDLHSHFEVLLRRGHSGSIMVIRVPKDKKPKRFIQFSKYQGGKKRGLQFDYPLANWSAPYYEKLKQTLKKNQIQYDIETTDQEGVPEFLVIDLKQGLKRAEKLSQLVFQEVYGLKEDGPVELFYQNIRHTWPSEHRR